VTDHPAPAGVPVCYRHPGRESHIRCQRCERPICPDCMNDASVGFQCPECLAEGRKATRSGRTTYGGLRPTNAATTSLVLIGINVVVWVAVLISGGAGSRLFNLLVLRPDGACDLQNGYLNVQVGEQVCTAGGGVWLPGVADGAWWQLMTSAFTHVQPLHIAFNMFALYLFGPQLEMFFGRARFLALYLFSALTGSAAVYWFSPEFSPTLGASGAIYGLMGALLVISLKVRVNVQGLVALIGINLLLTFTISNISWQGHLGGLVGGAAAAAVLVYAPRQRRTAYQVVGLVLLTALTVVAIAARTAQLA
jgi:membrane associated rhomboid family serine protease